MSTPLDSAVPQLRKYLCNNVFVQGGIAAAGYGTIARSLNPLVGLSAAAVSVGLGSLCSEDGFQPDDHLPRPHPLVGGQCQASYLVTATVQLTNFQSSGTQTVVASSSPNVAGPVGGFQWTPFPLEDNGQPRQWALSVTDANGQQRGMSSPGGEQQVDFVPGTVVNASAARQDGQLDDCGNLPAGDIQIIGDPDNDVLPPGAVTVPPPGGSGPSITLPVYNFKVEKLFGVDGPLVNFDVGGVKVEVDFGKDPPEVTDVSGSIDEAIDRIESELAEQGDALAQQGQDNADILQYLESIAQLLIQVRDCTCQPAVELESLWIPYVQCGEEGSASEMLAQVQVPRDTVGPDLIQALETNSDLAVLGCEGHPVYAVPDNHQHKRRFSPPTLVLVYRRGDTRGYHSYSIPNPASADSDQSVLLQSFRKGQTLVTVYLTDNSSIQVNCFDQNEAERVIDLLVGLVDGAFVPNPLNDSYSIRRGRSVGTEEMRLTSYSYYPEGDRNLRPAWTVRVSGQP